MKRKIIKQSDSYTITLPIEWIRGNNLGKNDEIGLTEEDNRLIIDPKEGKKRLKTTEIKVDPHHFNIYISLIGSFYRAGFDEIKVKFDDRKVIPMLQKAVDFLHGFELFSITNNSCVIKSVYAEEKTEIPMHVQKIISTIITMQSIIEEDMKKKSFSSKEEIFGLRNSVLKQRNLIARMIIQKRIFKENEFPNYNLAFNLWNIARVYDYLYGALSQKLTSEDISFIRETNRFFVMSLRVLESRKLEDRHMEYDRILKKGNELMKKSPSQSISFCLAIIILIQTCNSPLLMLNF